MAEPWWRRRGSVRARTTAASTMVVAVALLIVGLALLGVLRHNLVDSAKLQAETTARGVAGRLAAGAGPNTLDFPDPEIQPVQVVSSDGRVLGADRDLPLRGPMADFASTRAPSAGDNGSDSDDAEDDDGDSDDGAADDGDADDGDSDDADSDEADHEDGDRGIAERDRVDAIGPPGTALVRGRAQDPNSAPVTFRDMRLRTDDDSDPKPYQVAGLVTEGSDGRPVTIYAGASLATADNALAGVRTAMLVGLPLLLALIAAVTWLVTRRALRPVEAIRTELAEIMHGDLSRRVPVPVSRDEIARLADTTNDTLTALEQSSTRQRRFIADAAHELRSPVASLRTQLEVGRAHPSLLDMDALVDDTVRLEHLAADLLLLARIDAGEPPRADEVDLAELIREHLSSRAGDRHSIDIRLAADPAFVLGSRTQLGRVLSNLIDNAQRHAASAVRVDLSQADDGLVVEVCDDGPGVPLADRDRIFERFVRLDDARSRDEGGAGLGLAIVRDVVERHRGRIALDDGPAGGARFTVTLPAASQSQK